MKLKNINQFLGAIVMMLMLTPVLVLGANMQAGEAISIAKGNDVDGNLYVAAGNVSINSVVSGDLYTAGGNILITENVRDDIVAAGGSVTILGDSGDDVRVAGGNVLVAGTVGGELIAAGGSVTVSSDVVVQGDVVIAGGQASLDGAVEGDVEIFAGALAINGRVQGDVIAQVDGKLTMGDGAVIEGNLAYKAKSADDLQMGEGAVVTGEIVYEQLTAPTIDADKAENIIAGILGALLLLKIVVFVTAALVLLWLFRGLSKEVVLSPLDDFGRTLLRGFVILVVFPVGIVLSFVSILGLFVGVLALFTYIVLLAISSVYAGIIFGALLVQTFLKRESNVSWKTATVGIILLSIVGIVPIVGWIISLVFVLLALGQVSKLLYTRIGN